MTPQRLQEIKDIFKESESTAIKAEGAIEQLLKGLKENYNIDSIENAKEKLKELDEELEVLTKSMDEISKELESLTDWDKL